MTSEPQQTARLIFHADSMRRVLSIDSLPFRVGRSEHCNLVIPHPQVSREHASIEWNGSNYVLRDQSSRHGTFVNGVRVTSVILHAGDSIALGSRHTVLVFEDSDGDGSQTLLAQFSKRWSNSARDSDLEKLSLFLQAAQSFSSMEASQEVLRTMLEYSIRLTGAERGFVFLGENAEGFHVECGRDQQGT